MAFPMLYGKEYSRLRASQSSTKGNRQHKTEDCTIYSCGQPTRLRRWEVPLVLSGVRFIAQRVSRGPPVPRIILVVPVERANVKDQGFSSARVHSRVAVPAVPMDQAGLQHPPIRLQRQKEPWHHLVNGQPGDEVKLRPLEDGRGKIYDVAQIAGKDSAPRVIPLVNGLHDLGVDGGDMESELARRRDGAAVDIGEPRCQPRRFRGLFCQLQLGYFRRGRGCLTNLRFDVPELDEEKVGPAVSHLTPRVRLRDESRGHGVDGLEGLELAFAHLPTDIAKVGHDLGAIVSQPACLEAAASQIWERRYLP